MRHVQEFFEFERHQTSLRTEVIAGATTFMTMSYIIVVNRKVLQAAGRHKEVSPGPWVLGVLSLLFYLYF